MIGIVYGLTATHEADKPIPQDAALTIQYAVVSVWLRLDGEDDKMFEQRLEIVKPDGTRLKEHVDTTFKMTHRTHQCVLYAQGFPGEEGEHKLILSIRETGIGDWREVSEYPILVTHSRKEAEREQANP